MAPVLLVRAARFRDAAGIRAIHLAAIRQICARDYTPAQIAAWAEPAPLARYRDAIAAHPFLVAELDGALAGFAELELTTREVRAVYVHPRQLRRGVGRALLAELERLARDAGLHELRLDSSLSAAAFYRAAGYEPLEQARHLSSSGVELECIKMKRRL